jgi:CubicO group peptidase (beta-lactamase class C family)
MERLHVDTASGDVVSGYYRPAYRPVVEAFVANFEHAGELGAACAVYRDGELAVDLWGGRRHAGTGAPWRADTRSIGFSCSKGVLALCLAIAVERGLLDLDAPVATHWPEFAAAGKADITVRMALNHTSGLPHIDEPLTADELTAWEPAVRALAAQRPQWTPGQGFLYHGQTIGWLAGEVLRRATGLGPRAFLAKEIAVPLGVRAAYGVPPDELAELARVEPPLPSRDAAAYAEYVRLMHTPAYQRMLTMSGALPFPGFGGDETYNSAEVRTAELPAVNLIISARDLARIYAATVSDVDGVRLTEDDVLADMTGWESGGGRFESLTDPALRWGAGFMIDSPPLRPMLGPGSFGHDGAGGNLGFANRPHRIGFAYLTNQMGGIPDERANDLCRALVNVL